MNLADIREGIAERLQQVPGLRVHDVVPTKLEPPAAFVALGAGSYDEDFTDGYQIGWAVLLLFARADEERAQRSMDDFLSATGSLSILAAFDEDQSLNGSVDSSKVTGWTEPQSYTVGGIDYIGVELQVEVLG